MAIKDEIIEVTTNEGATLNCELFDMVEYNKRYYALLVEEGHAEDDEPELMIYRYREIGDDVYFEQISNAAEFNEVSQYVENLPSMEE